MLVYIHVPKTAGTTLKAVLEAYAGPEGMFSAYPGAGFAHPRLEDWRKLPIESKSRIKVVAGHYQYDAFKSTINSAEVKYMTFLRDPIDRIISLYKHHMASDPAFKSKPVSLLKFIGSSDSGISIQLRNHQVRMLAGIPQNIGLTREHLRRAVHNMNSEFLLVGLTESFDKGLIALSQKLGMPLASLNRLNVSRDSTDRGYYSDAEIDRIRELNGLDYELYDHVRRTT
jgi:hypothetical protein